MRAIIGLTGLLIAGTAEAEPKREPCLPPAVFAPRVLYMPCRDQRAEEPKSNDRMRFDRWLCREGARSIERRTTC